MVSSSIFQQLRATNCNSDGQTAESTAHDIES